MFELVVKYNVMKSDFFFMLYNISQYHNIYRNGCVSFGWVVDFPLQGCQNPEYHVSIEAQKGHMTLLVNFSICCY